MLSWSNEKIADAYLSIYSIIFFCLFFSIQDSSQYDLCDFSHFDTLKYTNVIFGPVSFVDCEIIYHKSYLVFLDHNAVGQMPVNTSECERTS